MIFRNPYWSDQTKIELLQKWILVHSYLYYEEDTGVVADAMFDNNCRQLRGYWRANKEAFKKSKWFRAFKEYMLQESNSGYTLYRNLNQNERAVIREEARRCKLILR